MPKVNHKRRADDLIFDTWPRWKRIRLTVLEILALALIATLIYLAINFEKVFIL